MCKCTICSSADLTLLCPVCVENQTQALMGEIRRLQRELTSTKTNLSFAVTALQSKQKNKENQTNLTKTA